MNERRGDLYVIRIVLSLFIRSDGTFKTMNYTNILYSANLNSRTGPKYLNYLVRLSLIRRRLGKSYHRYEYEITERGVFALRFLNDYFPIHEVDDER